MYKRIALLFPTLTPPTALPTNDCPDPGVPDNAGRSTVGLNVGDTVSYACLPGFHLVGLPTLTCLSNGQWSSSPPSCERKWSSRLTCC